MATLSKKSKIFHGWLNVMAQIYPMDIAKTELLVDLELAARIAIHDLDTMGEISPDSLHNLARATKKLEQAYSE